MTDIRTIPDSELANDLQESIKDMGWCRLALAQGVEFYGQGESGAYRMQANEAIATKILVEQGRRQDSL